ncbi:MAG: ATP-binding cassette domain-containing protein [Sediminibacterium sp.]|nr:ATP-binding cassette domain-containing protein [Sediminibacterium sp.]
MIAIEHISKSFGERTILNDISAVMDTGKCNLIIGASGSGKTVLTKCIVGLFQPDEGSILYDGMDMLAMKEVDKKELRQSIGMLFQGSALFDSMTVEENVMFPLHMFSKMSVHEKKSWYCKGNCIES